MSCIPTSSCISWWHASPSLMLACQITSYKVQMMKLVGVMLPRSWTDADTYTSGYCCILCAFGVLLFVTVRDTLHCISWFRECAAAAHFYERNCFRCPGGTGSPRVLQVVPPLLWCRTCFGCPNCTLQDIGMLSWSAFWNGILKCHLDCHFDMLCWNGTWNCIRITVWNAMLSAALNCKSWNHKSWWWNPT